MAKKLAFCKKQANQLDETEEQIREKQKEIKYDIRDFTIGYIVNSYKEGLFYIPDYQREFIWNNKKRWRFIESVILGLPIPMMFFADMRDGLLEIVDGAQRVQTLEEYLNDDLRLKNLGYLPTLNDKKFSDLPESQKRKFLTKALRIVILEDSTTDAIRQEIFDRINTGQEKARSSEIRRGAHSGPFMEFIKICARNKSFKQLCPLSKHYIDHREDEELLVRFFAYSENYKEFRHDVARFLDEYVKSKNENFDQATMEKRFKRMLKFVERHFENGFAKNANAKTTPRVRFEAIAVGVDLALKKVPNLIPKTMDWLGTEEFKKQTTTHASNSGPRLRSRIEFVRDVLCR